MPAALSASPSARPIFSVSGISPRHAAKPGSPAPTPESSKECWTIAVPGLPSGLPARRSALTGVENPPQNGVRGIDVLLVTPAKAGVQANRGSLGVLASRLRGNDESLPAIS